MLPRSSSTCQAFKKALIPSMHGNNVFKAAMEFTVGAVQQALHMVQNTLSSLQCINKFTLAATL